MPFFFTSEKASYKIRFTDNNTMISVICNAISVKVMDLTIYLANCE